MDTQVQQIKDRINIVEAIGQYVPLRRAGRNYVGRCPFHKERTPSFHVSPERGTYKCFGCGEGGDVFNFLQKIEGSDFPTVLKELADKTGIVLEKRAPINPQEREHDERLRELCDAAVSYFEAELKKRADVQEYLRNRGLREETISGWRLGYAPASWDSLSKHLRQIGFSADDICDAGFGIKSEKRPGEVFDRFRGRIIFPLFDVGGKPIAVSGRYFEAVPGAKQEGEPAKYVNSPETALFKKSRVLYGFDRARASIRKLDCILLVEGQFDLILSHQSGLPFAVAISGTALTEEHLMLLGKLSKRLVLALDGDAAGVRAGLKSALMALKLDFDVKVPTFAQGKDPADLARENPELLKAAIRTARPAVEFFIEALRLGARDERAYAKAVEASVLPLIAAMQSRIEQDQSIRFVAGRLGVSEDAVRSEVSKRPNAQQTVEEGSQEIHPAGAESSLTPLQKKVGMLLARFGRDSATGQKLLELLGQERINEVESGTALCAEELRFRFDSEVGEHGEEVIAGDMLQDIERTIAKERFKMKFL